MPYEASGTPTGVMRGFDWSRYAARARNQRSAIERPESDRESARFGRNDQSLGSLSQDDNDPDGRHKSDRSVNTGALFNATIKAPVQATNNGTAKRGEITNEEALSPEMGHPV